MGPFLDLSSRTTQPNHNPCPTVFWNLSFLQQWLIDFWEFAPTSSGHPSPTHNATQLPPKEMLCQQLLKERVASLGQALTMLIVDLVVFCHVVLRTQLLFL